MSQAPRSQNEITNVVKKFPNLLNWVEDLQKRMKTIEEAASAVVNDVKEQIETVSLDEFTKFRTTISNSLRDLENLKSAPKELAALKKEVETLKEKVKTLESSAKKEATKTKTPETTENTSK